MLLGDKPTAKDIQDGWWPEAHNQNRINRRVCQCLRLEYIIICSGVEQRLKHVKPHRDDHLPVATIHPDCKYEWVLEKPGLTTPTQYSGIGHWLVFKTYMSFNGKFFWANIVLALAITSSGIECRSPTDWSRRSAPFLVTGTGMAAEHRSGETAGIALRQRGGLHFSWMEKAAVGPYLDLTPPPLEIVMVSLGMIWMQRNQGGHWFKSSDLNHV